MYFQSLCVLVMLLSLVLSPPVSSAAHRSWHDHYTDFLGMRCCTTDCVSLPVSLLGREGDRVEVLVAGLRMVLPAGSVHQSEDAQSWACLRNPQMPPSSANIRCVFFAVAG